MESCLRVWFRLGVELKCGVRSGSDTVRIHGPAVPGPAGGNPPPRSSQVGTHRALEGAVLPRQSSRARSCRSARRAAVLKRVNIREESLDSASSTATCMAMVVSAYMFVARSRSPVK